MFGRFFLLVICQVIPAAIAWSLGKDGSRMLMSVPAALAGGYLWMAIDALYSARLLRWLRSGQLSSPPGGPGIWSEIADRVRRLVRVEERAAAEFEQRLRAILSAIQASPNGVVLLDADGRIEWLNQTAASHFGLDAERDLLQHFGNLVRDPAFAAYYANANFQQEMQMPGRSSNASKPVTLSVQLHGYGQGRSMLLSRDVTALEQAEAMRRDFVANVSHEIRTPLTVLAGFVETLQSLPLDIDERGRYLGMMSQQSQRLQTLVSDLLTLSRLEGSPPPPAHDWVSLDALMGQCAQDARDLASLLWGHSEGIQFHFDPRVELAGSSVELHSAMANLVVNAIRYSPAGRPIEVNALTGMQGDLTFSVRDQGHGIAPEHLPRLTERFYRVDRSRSRETGGTGLGLAIVKHVAQRHGGSLHIESTEGRGSCFTIQFPASRVRSRDVALTDV